MFNENDTKKVQNKKLHLVFNISLVLFIYSAFLLLISVFNETFADVYSNTLSSIIRKILSYVTGLVPFSVAEIVLFLSPVLLFLVIFGIVRCVKKQMRAWTLLRVLLSVVFIMFFLFVNTFGVCYFRMPLEDMMGLYRQELSREDVYNTTISLKLELENSVEPVLFSDDGASVNPYDWLEFVIKLNKSYNTLNERYPFLTKIQSRVKRLVVSPLMTYTHISGIYIPFTGEANVNYNYPDYVTVYTAAHEMAHQRGIAGEDEANFVAFLACVNCEDEYIKYCGLMSMYDYFLDSLYENDEEMYKYMVMNTDKKILGEMYSYYNFFQKYSHSVASEIADSVNDSYLKTLGVDDGVRSYGKVIELYYAYYNKN